jgi:hypothetical protein
MWKATAYRICGFSCRCIYANFPYFLVENIIKETLNYDIINYMDPHVPGRMDPHIDRMDPHIDRMDLYINNMDPHINHMNPHINRMNLYINRI